MKKKIQHKQQQIKKNKPPELARAKQSGKRKYYAALFIVLLISFVAFLPVFNNGLLAWDDDRYITDNPLVHSINLKDIFSSYVMGNYHPLTILTFAFEYQLFGLNEDGYHAVNLLLHLVNVFLVYRTVLLLSNKQEVSLVASLLFGIHPLHVESVAWAAELKDLLYACFFLTSYIFYLKFLKSSQKKFYVFALLMFALSLLSKAMAASLPLVLLLTDYFKGRKIELKNLLEKTPFFLMAIVLGVVAVWAQQSDRATEVIHFPLLQRIVFASYGFMSYLVKLFFPLELSAYYPYPVKSGESLPALYLIFPVLCAGLGAFVFYWLRFSKKIIFGIVFFAITLFLVLQLLPVGGAIMADRYSYIPSIGIFYLAGEGFFALYNKKLRTFAFALLAVFAVFFLVKTYTRTKVWENDFTLWDDVISRYQTISIAYNNRGHVFLNEGKNEQALADFNKAIEIDSTYVKALNNRGTLFMNTGRYDEAVVDFDKAIGLMPGFEALYINRANVLMNQKKPEEALKDFDMAIQLMPTFPVAYYSRAMFFAGQNKFEQALQDYSRAIELKNDYAEAYINRGNLFRDNKRINEALRDYGTVIELQPGFELAYFNRGTLYMNEKRNDLAINDFNKAIELKPDYVKAYYNKGNVYYNDKKYDEAINNYSKAIALMPNYAEVYYSRGLAEYYAGKKDASCNDLNQSVRLGYQSAAGVISQICN